MDTRCPHPVTSHTRVEVDLYFKKLKGTYLSRQIDDIVETRFGKLRAWNPFTPPNNCQKVENPNHWQLIHEMQVAKLDRSQLTNLRERQNYTWYIQKGYQLGVETKNKNRCYILANTYGQCLNSCTHAAVYTVVHSGAATSLRIFTASNPPKNSIWKNTSAQHDEQSLGLGPWRKYQVAL